jgi:hypothetical protein
MSQNAFDTFGLIEFPTSTDVALKPLFKGWGKDALSANEQTLAVIGDFLGVWLVNDGQVGAAWRAITGSAGPDVVKTMWLHDPSKVIYSSDHSPSFYLWRESAMEGWDADDWQREHAIVKGLWVFPIALQEKQFRRAAFGSVLAKAIAVGIERGRTPGWRQPLDPDPLAQAQGSLFYTFAGFDEFKLTHWDMGSLKVRGANRASPNDYENYPAVDFTFELTEKVEFGLTRSPPYYPMSGMDDTVQTVTPAPFTRWTALTVYPPNSFVVPVVANGQYYVGRPLGGRSGATQPTFPTTPGASVADGTQFWTCIGPINGPKVSGALETPIVTGVDEP